jgi:hypothetical protein
VTFFACAQKRLLSMGRAVVDGKGVPPSSNCPILRNCPFPFNNPLLFVIPSEASGSAVRHSGAPNLPFYNSKLPRQSRHPGRSASQFYRVTQRLMARSRRACPERSRGNPEGADLNPAARSFSTTEARTWRTRHGLSLGPATSTILGSHTGTLYMGHRPGKWASVSLLDRV